MDDSDWLPANTTACIQPRAATPDGDFGDKDSSIQDNAHVQVQQSTPAEIGPDREPGKNPTISEEGSNAHGGEKQAQHHPETFQPSRKPRLCSDAASQHGAYIAFGSFMTRLTAGKTHERASCCDSATQSLGINCDRGTQTIVEQEEDQDGTSLECVPDSDNDEDQDQGLQQDTPVERMEKRERLSARIRRLLDLFTDRHHRASQL